jgi:hypothetical protein
MNKLLKIIAVTKVQKSSGKPEARRKFIRPLLILLLLQGSFLGYGSMSILYNGK